jgi:cytochrome c peroxidase
MLMQKSYFLLAVIVIVFSCHKKNASNTTLEQLGRKLFFDNALSLNNTRSCGTCHNPQFAFTDSYKKSTGIYGDDLKRNSRPLFNLREQTYLTAADSTVHHLEQQMNNPFFNNQPHELGMKGNEAVLIQRIQQDKTYQSLFREAFSQEKEPIHFSNIKKAIASYIQTIESYNSRYDAFKKGNTTSLTADEQKGMQLFFSEKLTCAKCHQGNNFDQPTVGELYFNTGLYNINNQNDYPLTDQGLYEITSNPRDRGKFKVPTLRNLQYTKPYYHDGSAETINEVINNYLTGGRKINEGDNKGDGRVNQNKHPLITPLQINDEEKRQLILFLGTLNDSTIVNK